VPGISVQPSEGNALEWLVQLDGPATYVPPNSAAERPSPYAGRRFALKVVFPEQYPFKAPALTFREGVMYHPIVSQKEGTLCVNVIDSFWGPTKMAADLLTHIRNVLAHPTAEGAVNMDASAELNAGNVEAFEKKAREAAAKEPAI
jgi:ubiquitin-protein ligase